MTWHEAIDDLERQFGAWAPDGVRVESQTWSEDPSVNVLVFARDDLRGERRVTLEPVSWKRDEVPTAADLYNSLGSRLRLQGPDAEGRWRFLTNDFIPLKVAWNEADVSEMLDTLLKV